MPTVVPYQRPFSQKCATWLKSGVINGFNEKSNFIFVSYVHQVFLSIEHYIKIWMKRSTTVI